MKREIKVCQHCHEQIMEFEFQEGKQWWHANPLVSRVTSLHCHQDPNQPVAEP